jgi:hypothetical protein
MPWTLRPRRMNIRSRVDRLERVAGLLEEQSQSTGALPWWHDIDISQLLKSLSDEELRALRAAVLAFQAGLGLTPVQETLVLRCQEALEQEKASK